MKKRLFIYGWHACLAALANPERTVHRVCLVKDHDREQLRDLSVPIHVVDSRYLQTLLGSQAIHQGIACEVSPLLPSHLSLLETFPEQNQIVVCLDCVTDPQNVGSIMRSCATFGVKALMLMERHAPMESAVLVKAASGAFDRIPLIRIGNLSQALKELKNLGFWTIGLAEEGNKALNAIDCRGKIAIVMGSEGEGLRRLTRDNLDFLAYLPTHSDFTTLNVSTATAISLYEVFRQHQG